MAESLPPDILVEDLPNGVRYRLPLRPLGAWRWLGLVPLVFGLVFAGGALAWMMTVAQAFPAGDLCSLVFVAWGIPFLAAGLFMAGFGLLILAGHSEIELRGETLRAVDRWGVVRWARRRPTGSVRRFIVSSTTTDEDGKRVSYGDLAAVLVECDAPRKPMVLAPGYTRAMLLPLANELARRLSLSEASVEVERPLVEVIEEKAGGTGGFQEVLHQPEESQIEVEKHADGLTLTVPPAGLWRGSKGLFFFGLIWCGFVGFITALLIGVLVQQGDQSVWLGLLFLGGIFWPAGIGMLLGAINMGRRRAVLAVVGDRLLIMQTGIFGSKRSEWERSQIADIRTGPSGMEMNDQPVIELQIHPAGGKKWGMLAGRSERELRWLATVLRLALRIGGG